MLKPSVTATHRIGVVVVSFNTISKLRRCLTCLGDDLNVVVVDNASTDGSPEMVRDEFPSVHLICNSENIGLGKANNQGASALDVDQVLFLNSDAYAETGAVLCLASVFEDPNVIAAGGKLINPDRSLQLCTANELNLWAVFCEQTYLEKLAPNSKLLSPYWTTAQLSLTDEPSETSQVMGASLMVRTGDSGPIEHFDERYFLYCEDTDLCKRLRSHGKIVYVPKAVFVHDLGSSSSKDPTMGIIRYNRGKELYFSIHHGRAASFLCLILDRLGALLRLLGWFVKALLRGFTNVRSNGQIKVFWRVLTASRRSP